MYRKTTHTNFIWRQTLTTPWPASSSTKTFIAQSSIIDITWRINEKNLAVETVNGEGKKASNPRHFQTVGKGNCQIVAMSASMLFI